MRTIWKFPFDIREHLEINMPIGAEVLHVERQRTRFCMWALVDPDAKVTRRRFRVFATGEPIPPVFEGRHLATVQDGNLVSHVFDK